MTKLSNLLQNITERIQPVCIQASKKKYFKNKVALIINFFALFGFLHMLSNSNIPMLWLLLALSSFSILTWQSIFYFELMEHYSKTRNMHNTLEGNEHMVALYGDKQLTDAETDALLAIPLSEKVIAVLNDAVSNKGFVEYIDVLNMYRQQQSEEKALVNHKNFISDKHYSDPVQQQNLDAMGILNQPKQIYKSFNSRKVL